MNRYQFNLKQQLLVFALVISPFTLLRFSFFGLSESIILFLFIGQVLKPVSSEMFKSFQFTRFWLIFIFFSTIGAIYNILLLNQFTGTFEGLLFDGSSYVFILLACFSLERMIHAGAIDLYRTLKWTFLCSSLTMAALYVISLYVPAIFGLPLRYYHYFVPLANNLHQISMFLAPLPFIGLVVAAREQSLLIRGVTILLALLDSFLALQTGSTKAFLAIGCGFLIYFGLLVVKSANRGLIYLSGLGVLILVSLNLDRLVDTGEKFFVENDGGGARAFLYSHAVDIGFHSFIFGLGPGQHVLSMGSFSDAHQTFLTVYLQGGVIGVALLAYLFYRILHRQIVDPAIFAGCMAILIYALGGDIMRRLPIWAFLVMFYNYGQKPRQQS